MLTFQFVVKRHGRLKTDSQSAELTHPFIVAMWKRGFSRLLRRYDLTLPSFSYNDFCMFHV